MLKESMTLLILQCAACRVGRQNTRVTVNLGLASFIRPLTRSGLPAWQSTPYCWMHCLMEWHGRRQAKKRDSASRTPGPGLTLAPAPLRCAYFHFGVQLCLRGDRLCFGSICWCCDLSSGPVKQDDACSGILPRCHPHCHVEV